MATDVQKYPHVWDDRNNLWHKRTGTGQGDGPNYPTRCGNTIRSFMVDVPEGGPESREDRCADGCYR